eukprot:9105159-Alexandrium_andersonii.AAC.1
MGGLTDGGRPSIGRCASRPIVGGRCRVWIAAVAGYPHFGRPACAAPRRAPSIGCARDPRAPAAAMDVCGFVAKFGWARVGEPLGCVPEA